MTQHNDIMVKAIKFSCSLIFMTGIILFSGCTKSSGTIDQGPSPPPAPASFHGVRIYIVSAGDIHEYSQNLAGLATLVKNIRDTASFVYFVLAGDFFMAHRSYDVKRCNGQTDSSIRPDLKVPADSDHVNDGMAESRIVEYLNFDAIVPGNHDWTYGIAMLASAKLKRKIVACNLGQPENLAADYLTFSSKPCKFRLNIIGVAATDNIHSKGQETVRVYSLTTSTSLSKIKSAIAKADMNILLTHLLSSDDASAFSSLTGARGEALFDVLCGGHTHESFAKITCNAVYMKAGIYGTYAGIACLWWDTVKTEVVKKTASLVCLENIPKDPGTLALIDSLHRVYPHY
ncbi:MAG: metallophosphoesterase [Bacteroidetes bacterium]|nr:metallophosphoesterase [Bacteroidota bacterium]